MNNPKVNKKIVALSLTIAVALIACLIAHAFDSKIGSSPSSYTATISEPFRPTPLYGSNSINTHGPSWSDNAFSDTIASIDFKLVRYPGGSFGDFWDWQKGWFIDRNEAVQKNAQIPAPYAKTKFSATGLEDLKLLTDKAKSDVLFELNMVTRDVDDQVKMLKHAQQLGFKIKWIELGNEFNMPKSTGRVKYNSAKAYGNECNRWTRVIKQTFPNAKIGVIGGNMKYNSDVANWNRTVLDAAPIVDAIVAHIYPLPKNILDNSGINFKNLYNDYKSQYADQGFGEIKDKDIWFTEYNIHWAQTKVDGMDHTAVLNNAFTWGQSLAMVLMTSESTILPKNPSIVVNTSLANWRGFASAEVRKGEVHLLPNGIGFRAWCRAADGSTTMGKIIFKDGRDVAKDFEITGWDFKSNKGDTYLITNFTGSQITVDVSSLNTTRKVDYKIMHADKSKKINDLDDIDHETARINNGKIILPPYSIVTM